MPLTGAQVVERLELAQIANARVNTMQDVWAHPQLKARGRWTEVGSPKGTLPAMLPPGTLGRGPAHGPGARAWPAHRCDPRGAGLWHVPRSRPCTQRTRSEVSAMFEASTQARTYLFVPGTRPERFGKALASGADAVVLDLEDAVAADDKAVGPPNDRELVQGATPADRSRIVVRINDAESAWFSDDLLALRRCRRNRRPAAQGRVGAADCREQRPRCPEHSVLA